MPTNQKSNRQFKALLLVGMLCALVVVAVGATRTPSDASDAIASDAVSAEDAVARGRYLVTIAGCHDCHTPWVMGEQGPEPDMTRMLSGHPQDLIVEPPTMSGQGWGWVGADSNTAFAGPWGVSFTANLTPHHNGLGAWTEEIFMQTLRSGLHWGQSRPILPPMPWFNYGKMTDEDLKAVFAFLQSIPPIDNTVPLPIPPVTEGAIAEVGDSFFE